MFLNCVESSKLLITSFSSLFLHLYTLIVKVKSSKSACGRLGILSMVKLMKKSLSRGRALTRILKTEVKMATSRKNWSFTIPLYWT